MQTVHVKNIPFDATNKREKRASMQTENVNPRVGANITLVDKQHLANMYSSENTSE